MQRVFPDLVISRDNGLHKLGSAVSFSKYIPRPMIRKGVDRTRVILNFQEFGALQLVQKLSPNSANSEKPIIAALLFVIFTMCNASFVYYVSIMFV